MVSDPVSRTKREQWLCFLLVGCLSMLYAELFSGASQLWFANVWALLVTFPLYMVHVLFFFNLALYTRKTSPVHLYLWGILFGMYESWITQVLWIGYQNTGGPMIQAVLGIGLGEFVPLVFFWHPVLSFILPLFVFQLFALSADTSASERVLPSHVPYLVKIKSNLRYGCALYIIGSVFMAHNYQGNIVLVVLALGGTYALIYVLYKGAKKYSFSVYSLRVGSKGLKIMAAYLVALYVIMFVIFGYFGGRIPGILPVVTTIALYMGFIWIVKTAAPAAEVAIPLSFIKNRITLSDYGKFAVFNVILASGLCIVFYAAQPLLDVVFLFLYGAMGVIGCYLFLKGVLLRNSQTEEALQRRYHALLEVISGSSAQNESQTR